MSGRQAANAMTRLTWVFGIAIFCTSIGLTVIAAREASDGSIMDQMGVPEQQQAPASNLPSLPAYTPPPSTGGDPMTPPAPDAPAASAPAPAAPENEAPAADAVTPPAAEAPAETTAPEAASDPAPEEPAAPAPSN